jgi:DNA-binding NarL/FixJ family response regulator
MINSVVLAEDNLEHCFFFKKALKEVVPSIQFTEVHDGDKLMELLKNYHPDLLFLDLSMPCKDGVQCIKEIRENKVYDTLPIVVFTISKQNNAIQTAYGFGANLYFVKPSDYSDLATALRTILSMDWSDPKSITEKYFCQNKYTPFQV